MLQCKPRIRVNDKFETPIYHKNFITWLKENVPSDSLEESALAVEIGNDAGEVPW